MTHHRTSTIRRRFFSDIAVVFGLAALVGVEAASLVSAADELSLAPGSGLVLDARSDEPGGLAVGQPCAQPLIDDRLAARSLPQPATGDLTL
jgi:hypothetical protein